MSNPTKIGAAGLALVKEFESFPNGGRPYWDRPASDPRRVLTIGYGTTRINGRPVRSSDRLTEPEASKLLVSQINGSFYAGRLTAVLNSVGLKLNQNQYDALLSAVYNLGAGILERGRTLGDALRTRNLRAIANAILVYDEPNNPSVHKGLARRRRAEVSLFNSKRGLDKPRPIKMGAKEKEHAERLRAERRSAARHGGWSNIAKSHNDDAVESKAWLIARANHLAGEKVEDKEYRDRKVKLLRDVAHDRNGKGR